MSSGLGEIEVFTTDSGSISVLLAQKTVWLTQRQMGEVFGTTPENILMHLKNIYKDQELEQEATFKDFLVVQNSCSKKVGGLSTTEDYSVVQTEGAV